MYNYIMRYKRLLQRKRKLFLALVLIITSGALLRFGYVNFVMEKLEQKENIEYNDNLINENVTINDNNTGDTNNENQEDEVKKTPITVNFDNLLSINKDVCAWIYQEGTPINYVVVQGDDNLKYTTTNLNGEYSASGTVFIDYANYNNFTDYITVLYGHRMMDRTMFGSLDSYMSQSYYNEHKNLYILTPTKNYILTVAAAILVDKESNLYLIPKTLEARDAKLHEFFVKSYITTDIEYTDEDKFVMLSTCYYNDTEMRVIVLAKLDEM